MSRMTVKECIAGMSRYFGTWENTVVLVEVSEELSKYDDSEVFEIYRQTLRGRPVKFGPPDVASVETAIEMVAKRHTLTLRSGEKAHRVKCPVCSANIACSTCGHCGYEIGDNVQEHADWWDDYQAGRAPKLNMQQLIDNIINKSSVRRFTQ